MANKKKIEKTQEEINEELAAEKMSLLLKADEVKGQQLFPTAEGQIIKAPEIAIGKETDPIDDPEKKFDIYYNNINRMLRRALPKGKAVQKCAELHL